MNSWLEEHLVCPRDHQKLQRKGSYLVCPHEHAYPVVDGIPIMLLNDVVPTQWNTTATLDRVAALSKEQSEASDQFHLEADVNTEPAGGETIDPHVQNIVVATCGILYMSLTDKLTRYPIPEMRLPPSNGKTLLDVGCNWGRWCVAAARKGYQPVGIDPALEAIVVARRVSRQLNVDAVYVVADARYLPFAAESFDVVFSYSVLQHFSKENAKLSITEAGRVLKSQGISLIQLPNIYGIRCLYHQFRRRFREAQNFEVRYWKLNELRKTFTERVGPTRLSVDGYFGLGVQKSDLDMLPPHYQLIVHTSEVLRAMSRYLRWMVLFADSIYVHSKRR